jgi:hypothetical protein
VITNAFGEVVSRRDFKPFGEQLEADGTYRTASLYSTAGDNIRQKFTGYQKGKIGKIGVIYEVDRKVKAHLSRTPQRRRFDGRRFF